MMFDNVFSVDTGVGSCWWHISDRAVLMDIAFWHFSNNYPNYGSMADAINSALCHVLHVLNHFWGTLIVSLC